MGVEGAAIAGPGDPLDVDGILTAIAAAARIGFSAAACSILVASEDESALVYRASSGAGAENAVGTVLPVGRGIAGWVVSSGQPIAIADLSEDPRFDRATASAIGYVPRSMVSMPIVLDGEPVGVMHLLDPTRDDDAFEFLAALARASAGAIAAGRRADELRPQGDMATALDLLLGMDEHDRSVALELVGVLARHARGGAVGR